MTDPREDEVLCDKCGQNIVEIELAWLVSHGGTIGVYHSECYG
jgi:hypothetical protein